jgi:hypothetical protein
VHIDQRTFRFPAAAHETLPALASSNDITVGTARNGLRDADLLKVTRHLLSVGAIEAS